MKVASFFRSHTRSFEVGIEPRDRKKSSRQNSGNLILRPKLGDRNISSADSISSDEGINMSGAHHHNSFSLIHGPGAKASNRSNDRNDRQTPTNLKINIESPPLVLFGQPSTSTGALLSGLMKLNVSEDDFGVESFSMKLCVELKMKKPFHGHCADCSRQSTELTKWVFFQGPSSLRKGEHDFPFSFLLPGHLPASMNGSLSTIEYSLRATLKPLNGGSPLQLVHPLVVKRAIPPSDVPRQSIRIFPPTNLTAHVSLPSVIHPIGESTASLRLDGIIKRNTDTGTQTHWKLKRLTWRIDETQKVVSPACSKHAAKSGTTDEDEPSGTPHHEVRTLNSEELKSGWKSDYSGPDGCIELEFPYSIRPDSHPICDIKAEDGTEVSHVLVVEMIVAEEFAPIRRPHQTTPTGAARVLRMHFNTVVTERGGLGISWDEEQPPLYENVPASPPTYNASTSPYHGPAIPDYEELDNLTNSITPLRSNTPAGERPWSQERPGPAPIATQGDEARSASESGNLPTTGGHSGFVFNMFHLRSQASSPTTTTHN